MATNQMCVAAVKIRTLSEAKFEKKKGREVILIDENNKIYVYKCCPESRTDTSEYCFVHNRINESILQVNLKIYDILKNKKIDFF